MPSPAVPSLENEVRDAHRKLGQMQAALTDGECLVPSCFGAGPLSEVLEAVHERLRWGSGDPATTEALLDNARRAFGMSAAHAAVKQPLEQALSRLASATDLTAVRDAIALIAQAYEVPASVHLFSSSAF